MGKFTLSSGTVSPTSSPPPPDHFDPGDTSDSDSLHSLPFPAPLSRAPFSPHTAATFSPTAFLSSLQNRHQTLEDLRLELRNRSRELDAELLELVNRDYGDFVGLGRSLRGGEGRVEDLRVGLMRFRRDVEGVVKTLKGVEEEVRRGVQERRKIRAEKGVVMRCLDVSRAVEGLEGMLLLDSGDGTREDDGAMGLFLDGHGDGVGASGIDGPEGGGISSLARLQSIVTAYLCLQHLLSKPLPPGFSVDTHPFLKAQKPRIERIRKTILLDLGTALREVAVPGEIVVEGEEARRKDKLVGVMDLFLSIGEQAEAVRILRELGGRKGTGVERKVGKSSGGVLLPSTGLKSSATTSGSRMKMVYAS